MNSADPLDSGTFKELQDAAGADFVADLVDTFLEDAPRMLHTLRAALAASDADAFRRAAHSLKSNAQTFGALALGMRAREIELGGLPATSAAGTAVLDALEAEYQRAAAALKAMCRP
jgi:HPt (histidine-containing phosphotransfer) domain-containing protein